MEVLVVPVTVTFKRMYFKFHAKVVVCLKYSLDVTLLLGELLLPLLFLVVSVINL